jgi:hypothetical protein
MSAETPATPVAGTPAPAAAPAPALNAIQRIEAEIVTFVKQREQAVANVHAVEGAIQGAQHLLAILKNDFAKAEAEAKKLLGEVKPEAEAGIHVVEADAKKIVDAIEAEAKKL